METSKKFISKAYNKITRFEFTKPCLKILNYIITPHTNIFLLCRSRKTYNGPYGSPHDTARVRKKRFA